MRVALLLALLLFASAAHAQTPRDQARALFLQGLTRAYLEDHDAAIRHYGEALRLTPDEPAILAALAESYAARENFGAARLHAEQAIAADPQNPAHARLLADLTVRSGDVRGGIAGYEAILARAPDDVAALDSLVALYRQTGEEASAARALESYLSHRPEHVARWRQLATLYTRLGRADDARTASARALGIDPAALENCASLTPEQRFFLGLSPDCTTAPAAAEPSSAPSRATPASPEGAGYATGDFAETARRLRAELDRNPRDPILWAHATMALLEAGDVDTATRVADEGLLIFAGHLRLRIAAAYASLASGDAGGAEAHLQEAALSAEDAAPPAERAALLLAQAALQRTRSASDAADLEAEANRLTPDAARSLSADALAPVPGGTLARRLAGAK